MIIEVEELERPAWHVGDWKPGWKAWVESVSTQCSDCGASCAPWSYSESGRSDALKQLAVECEQVAAELLEAAVAARALAEAGK